MEISKVSVFHVHYGKFREFERTCENLTEALQVAMDVKSCDISIEVYLGTYYERKE